MRLFCWWLCCEEGCGWSSDPVCCLEASCLRLEYLDQPEMQKKFSNFKNSFLRKDIFFSGVLWCTTLTFWWRQVDQLPLELKQEKKYYDFLYPNVVSMLLPRKTKQFFRNDHNKSLVLKTSLSYGLKFINTCKWSNTGILVLIAVRITCVFNLAIWILLAEIMTKL